MQEELAQACRRLAKPAACGLVRLLWPLADRHRWCGTGLRCASCHAGAERSDPTASAVLDEERASCES